MNTQCFFRSLEFGRFAIEMRKSMLAKQGKIFFNEFSIMTRNIFETGVRASRSRCHRVSENPALESARFLATFLEIPALETPRFCGLSEFSLRLCLLAAGER